MKFYRKENDIVPFKYENKWWFCSSNNGFMLSCDRSTCKQWCHPSWMNEDRWQAASNEDESVVSWEIIHTEYVSSKSKTVPDRLGLGIIGYPNSEVIQESRKNSWKRGGYTLVNCEIHKELKEYWIWGMREEEEEENESFMIQWDYWGKFSITNFLDNWYHGECIGISSQDGGKYDTFWWQQWEKWQDKRQNLLYKIWTTQTISMDILKDIKNYTKGILPEISKNIKLIDYLIITQAWNKITNILLSLWREIPVIVDHLRVVEQIPINWESKVWKLIEKIKQNLISAVGIVSNFEQLKDLKVLDVVDEDKKIIEQNLEKNQNIFVKLSEAWKDLDQSKVIKWPGLLILQSNIKLIDILNRVAKFYDEESTEEKSIEEYKELFQSLKSTTYQGWLFDIMDQEIADFDKFKKDTEDILNEENNQDNVIDEEELNSDDDDSPSCSSWIQRPKLGNLYLQIRSIKRTLLTP